MSRRHLLLRELELAPRWRLRQAVPEPVLAPALAQVAANLVPAASFEPPVGSTPVSVPEMAVEPTPAVIEPVTALPAWGDLQRQVASCTACGLCQTRTHTVFGKGNPRARLMLVGEAPGAEEDKQGLPFVGKAGQLLDNMLAAIGLGPDDVFIANVLKCRPPGNRNPTVDEMAACADYLRWQIAHVKPDVLVTLGRFAAHALLQSDAAIGALRRETHQYQGTPLFVTFHPAYLLRSPGEKAKAWQDLLAIRRALASRPDPASRLSPSTG